MGNLSNGSARIAAVRNLCVLLRSGISLQTQVSAGPTSRLTRLAVSHQTVMQFPGIASSDCVTVAAETTVFCITGPATRRFMPLENARTDALAVSGNNVVGEYYYYDGIHLTWHGFLYNGTSYTTLVSPGSSWTQAFGVSGNNVVGYYSDGSTAHGFLYNGTSYTTLNPPGSYGATKTLSQFPATTSSVIIPMAAQPTVFCITGRATLPLIHLAVTGHARTEFPATTSSVIIPMAAQTTVFCTMVRVTQRLIPLAAR